jgi:hypothetical protein
VEYIFSTDAVAYYLPVPVGSFPRLRCTLNSDRGLAYIHLTARGAAIELRIAPGCNF